MTSGASGAGGRADGAGERASPYIYLVTDESMLSYLDLGIFQFITWAGRRTSRIFAG